MPEAARQHERIAEPKRRAALAAAANDVVLSPRVVDRLAFDEYVTRLRSEIDRATSESELLARRAEAGAVILDQLERFMGDNGGTIEHAAEVLAGIDQRLAASRELLDEVARRAAGLSQASREAEHAVEARSEAFQSRLRSIVDSAMDRFEETEDQLTARAASARRELLDRLEQMRSRGEDTLSRLGAKAADVESDAEQALVRAEARLDALRGPARELLASIESGVAALDARADEQISRVTVAAGNAAQSLAQAQAAARAQATALHTAITAGEATADRVREGCAGIEHEAHSRIDTLLTELGERAAAIVDRSGSGLEAAQTESRSAIEAAAAKAHAAQQGLEQTLDAVERAASSPSLIQTLEQVKAAETAAGKAAKQIRDLGAQAKAAQSILAEAILEGSTQIDALDARAEALRVAGVVEADRLERLLSRAEGIDDADRIDAIVRRVQEQTRAEMRDELEMATAALATLSERVRVLEAAAGPSAKPGATPAAKKPAARKSPANTAAKKKAASKKAASVSAASKTAEPKPAAPASPGAKAAAKPRADAQASSSPAA